MTASTSMETYDEICAEGLVSKLEIKVLGAVMDEPKNLTAGEIAVRVRGDKNTISPRISKLCRYGVLARSGKRRDIWSKRPSWTYRFTGRKPVKPLEIPKCARCAGTGRDLERAAG